MNSVDFVVSTSFYVPHPKHSDRNRSGKLKFLIGFSKDLEWTRTNVSKGYNTDQHRQFITVLCRHSFVLIVCEKSIEELFRS